MIRIFTFLIMIFLCSTYSVGQNQLYFLNYESIDIRFEEDPKKCYTNNKYHSSYEVWKLPETIFSLTSC